MLFVPFDPSTLPLLLLLMLLMAEELIKVKVELC
jgi:hypothetical protein